MAKKKTASRGASIVTRSAAPMVVVANAPKRRRAAAVARRVAGVARRGARRVGAAAAQRDLEVSAALGALALGYAEKEGDDGAPNLKLPTIGGYDPALVWGGASVFLPHIIPGFGKGKMMRRVSAAGVGVLCVGIARSVARGSAKVSGEED